MFLVSTDFMRLQKPTKYSVNAKLLIKVIFLEYERILTDFYTICLLLETKKY